MENCINKLLIFKKKMTPFLYSQIQVGSLPIYWNFNYLDAFYPIFTIQLYAGVLNRLLEGKTVVLNIQEKG